MSGFGYRNGEFDSDGRNTDGRAAQDRRLRTVAHANGFSLSILAEKLLGALDDILGVDEFDPLLVAILGLGSLTAAASVSVAVTTVSGYLSGLTLGVGVCIAAKWLWDAGEGATEKREAGSASQGEIEANTAQAPFSRHCPNSAQSGRSTPAQRASLLQRQFTQTEEFVLEEQFGDYFERKPDVRTTYLPDGTKVREFPGGVRTISRRFSDGTYLMKWQGYSDCDSIDLKAVDGTYIELFANGRKLVDHPSGRCYEDMPDGRRRSFTADYVLDGEAVLPGSVLEKNVELFRMLDVVLSGGNSESPMPPDLSAADKPEVGCLATWVEQALIQCCNK